jgi:hypothetical protein
MLPALSVANPFCTSGREGMALIASVWRRQLKLKVKVLKMNLHAAGIIGSHTVFKSSASVNGHRSLWSLK